MRSFHRLILLRFLLCRRSDSASLSDAYFKTQTCFCVLRNARQYVPVEPVVPEVDVVPFVVDVPLVDVPRVDVPPLPSALPLDVVALFVTGAPVPVSVAVVPLDVGCSVSVDPVVVSAGWRLHAVQRRRIAMKLMTPRMRIRWSSARVRSNRRAWLARDVNGVSAGGAVWLRLSDAFPRRHSRCCGL